MSIFEPTPAPAKLPMPSAQALQDEVTEAVADLLEPLDDVLPIAEAVRMRILSVLTRYDLPQYMLKVRQSGNKCDIDLYWIDGIPEQWKEEVADAGPEGFRRAIEKRRDDREDS